MSRDDVIKMAREAGVPYFDQYDRQLECEAIEHFAQLVAAHEREECAKVCDEEAKEPECPERAAYCAAAIRARGAA